MFGSIESRRKRRERSKNIPFSPVLAAFHKAKVRKF
jgi:hypothetical protein